jgi:hypothetical protein
MREMGFETDRVPHQGDEIRFVLSQDGLQFGRVTPAAASDDIAEDFVQTLIRGPAIAGVQIDRVILRHHVVNC